MLSAGKVLFLAFFDICRLQKGPQDIPESGNLLTVCLVVYGLLSILLASFSHPAEKAVIAGFIEVLLIMIFCLLLLHISGRLSRWTQTMTALVGTGVIFSIIALPIYILAGVGELADFQPTMGTSIGLLLLAVLACWNIVTMAHILRHALEAHFAIAVFLSIMYIWIIFSFISAIIPLETS